MIVLIDNYDSFTYNLEQLIRTQGIDVIVKRHDKITCDEIQALAPTGIVLSPGPGRPQDAGICLELVKHFSGRLPILGICLGHQVIAEAFGGQVIQAETIMHGKTSLIFHHRGPLYQNMALPFEAGRYHSLMVDKPSLPSILNIHAETADEQIMGIQHATHPTFGVQFHPESILSDDGAHLIQNFLMLTEEEALTC